MKRRKWMSYDIKKGLEVSRVLQCDLSMDTLSTPVRQPQNLTL